MELSTKGTSFGSTANAIGEVVFNTSLTGYQEIATDPSYRFQIVVMTYPHIGNYGVEKAVEQSEEPQVAGFVVRDAIDEPSNAHVADVAGRVLRAEPHHGHPGHRHARPDAQDPQRRGDARHDHHASRARRRRRRGGDPRARRR